MYRIVRTSTLVFSLCAWTLLALGLSSSPPAGAAATSPPTVNATTWTQGTIPSSGSGSTNVLDSVSCTTADFCMATGQTGAASGALIEQWNGTTWSVVSNPAIAGGLELQGVSCVGTTFCAAVGAIVSGVVIEQWNGTAWSQATIPQPSGASSAVFNGVTCQSSTNCTAVGDNVSGSTTLPLVEQWNGTAWSIVTAPAVTGADTTVLESVSCGGPSFCAATGQTATGSLTTTLVEQWNGSTWSIVTSPNGSTAGSASNNFSGVSCVGASFCQAVGSFNDGVNVARTYAAQYNGSTWAQSTTADASPTDPDVLSGVDCFSPTTCSAVGETLPATGTSPAPLAEVWNGSTWTTATTPTGAAGATETAPTGVSCLTNWECVSVGSTTVGGTIAPFVMSAPIARSGYRFVATDGGVFSYGAGAPFLGSTGGTHLNKPIVGLGIMPGGDGYDLVASDGGIFNYGSAQFYGSAGSIHLNQPIVGMAMTADGGGYWLVASDGGIFSYGDAQFYGSTGNIKLNKPIVGMAATPDGKGYYLVASDGGIFNYGDATFQGSAGNIALNKPVVGIAAPVAGGYYLVATDGGIFTYPTSGGPPFEGSTGAMTLNKPIVGMTTAAGGYYLSASDGGVFTFPTGGVPPFLGSTGNIVLNQPIVGIVG
jgi:hypothetical protein